MRQAKGRASVDEWLKQNPEFYSSKKMPKYKPASDYLLSDMENEESTSLTPEYKQWLYIVAGAFALGVCWGALICLMLG
jgi:hypothetical protein